jgi:large subunit ribosomal protein L24
MEKSKQARKQRNLSTELAENVGRRSVRVVKGDTVKIVRGDAAILGLEGKVTEVKTETGRIIIEGVTVKKADAKMESRSVHASNCVVTKLELKDQWRKDKLQKKEASS